MHCNCAALVASRKRITNDQTRTNVTNALVPQPTADEMRFHPVGSSVEPLLTTPARLNNEVKAE